MAAASTVYDAKDAIQSLLAAHTWPDEAPTILWEPPPENEDWAGTFDAVYFGNQPGITVTHRILGRPRADEEYRIQVVVDVNRYGDDPKATERRMWDLVDEILQILRDNVTLNGTIQRMGDYSIQHGNKPAGQLWRSQVVIDIAVVGHIHY
jgi:hypothetical protein